MREYDINPDLLDMSQSTEVFHKVGYTGPCLKIRVARKLHDTSLSGWLQTEVEKGFM